ncbi:MAG: hypothetical protein AB8B48_12535 [Pseudomonadales bacterium]
MSQSLLRRLGVRDQTLSNLSMCKADKSSVEEWIGNLPVANIGETIKQLYLITEELLKLQTPADNRLELLSLLAPRIESNLQSLSKHYQHKQALLPKKSQQVVDLTHSLRMCVANNYTLAAVELAHSKTGLLRRPNKSQTARAVCGAMQFLNDDLLLCYQLYTITPHTLWFKLHQLYNISCELQIEHTSSGEHTPHGLYGKSLLLGSIKANQLRQEDLLPVIDLIPGWIDKISISRYQSGQIPSLFMLNRDNDRGPVYSHLLNKQALGECQLQLGTTDLVQYLRLLVDSAEDGVVEEDGKTVRIDLLNHLILAWGKCTKRSFMRIDSEEKLDICVGLDAAHHFSAGDTNIENMRELADAALAREAAFEEFHDYEKLVENVEEQEWGSETPQISKDEDGVECIDYDGTSSDSRPLDPSEQVTVHVHVNNASPGGYSLTLPDTDKFRIHAGDLIGIKDSATELWSIAAIRWLHRPTRTELTFGVELLSPAFLPSIGRSIQTEGDPGEYSPVLMLPEVSVTEQGASLLISDANVEVGQTMQILDRDQIRMVRITEQITKTRVYGQYSYEIFDAANDSVSDSQDLFDALWGNL